MKINDNKNFLDDKDILRKVQEVEVGILLEFDRICKKHKIPYQLFAGTLLGAIRHKGFIPWDDDIDVCMIRKDYVTFLEIARTELNSDFFLQTHKTDKGFFNSYAKIRKNNTLLVENDTEDTSMHKGIFIDVFPLDNVKYNTWQGELQRKIIFYLQVINQSKLIKTVYKEKNAFKRSIMFAFHYILKVLPNRLIDNVIDKVAVMHNGEETEHLSEFGTSSHSVVYHHFIVKRTDLENSIHAEFEGNQFPIPRNYDSVLKRNYGDYMKLPPINNRISHHGIIEISFETKI